MGRGESGLGALELLDELEAAGSSREYAPDSGVSVYTLPEAEVSAWIADARSAASQIERAPAADSDLALRLVGGLLPQLSLTLKPVYGQRGEAPRASFSSDESLRGTAQREAVSLALINHLSCGDPDSQETLITALRNEADRRELLELSRSAKEMIEFSQDKLPGGLDDIAAVCRVKIGSVKRWLKGASCGSEGVLRQMSCFFYHLERVRGWSSGEILQWLETPIEIDGATQRPIEVIRGTRWGRQWALLAAETGLDLNELMSWTRPNSSY